MAVNRDKVDLWKEDVAKSVDFYNDWFMNFAPKAYRETRVKTTKQVAKALESTANLTDISPKVLEAYPNVLAILRMATCPPIARDRLIGLADVNGNLVKNMELSNRVPPRRNMVNLTRDFRAIGTIIEKLADPDILVWLSRGDTGSKTEVKRAASIIADRLCGSMANPIIRNAQEQRQLASIGAWLDSNGYRKLNQGEVDEFTKMPAGTYSFRFNIPINQSVSKTINISVDAVVMRKNAKIGDLPALFEAKSAGDFTNTNKRRKEEAIKMQQLKSTYGKNITFDLFLCGYFDSGYLGYEAAEGIDWVWEHRIDDLSKFNL